MPGRPLVIFDGQCGFCRIWVRYSQQLTGDAAEYTTSQEAASQYPQIPRENFSRSVQLLMPDGAIHSGALAVFSILALSPEMPWLLWLYHHLPGFAVLSEAAYRVVAARRSFFYQLTRFTVGRNVAPLRYARAEWLFLRALASIYLIAFASFGLQITGLIGEHGILPIGRYLSAVHASLGARGYWMMPGVFWFAHGDSFLRAMCMLGAVLSIALLLGFFERIALVALYVLYLSLCSAGQDFMSFQWDMLLLEAGFLAIFLGSSRVVVLLFRWLLFRLMFLSGAVKLMSHDHAWRSLDAMSFHYWTQPLPTPIAWYMSQLPGWFQRCSTAAVLVIELAFPFLIFFPRLWRYVGGFAILFLQALIFLTGNYTFFNLLAAALCLFLFDDGALARFKLRARNVRTHRVAIACITALVIALSVTELWGMFTGGDSELVRDAASFGVVNTYGLFAVMTTSRPEIIVQGSDDGTTWLDYEFKYKPGDLKQMPKWVAPYQPRLDWQMWFAALSNFRANPWFTNFMIRLLQGSPGVLSLLARNPFPNGPPKYVRALVYEYQFTDFATRRATGDWWRRTPRGRYFPEISLDSLR